MQFEARYYNGESLEPKHVVLGFEAGRMLIEEKEGVRISAHPKSDIVLLYADRLGNRVDLGFEGLKDHRLMIEQDGVKQKLVPHLPQLAAPPRGEGWAAGFKVSAFLFAFVAFIVILAWQIERVVPHFIPDSYAQSFGRAIADSYIEEYGGVCTAKNGELALSEMVTRLAEYRDFGTPLTVRVADSELVNAFAVPGGQIVIFRGLIEKAASADEVAGVLAHEMGHVKHKHALRGLTRAVGLSIIASIFSGGDVSQFAQQLVSLGFSRAMEEEADQTALNILNDADISSEPLAGFFERLSKEQEQGFIGNLTLLSTHPASEGRAEVIRQNVDYNIRNYRPVLSDDSWEALQNICK